MHLYLISQFTLKLIIYSRKKLFIYKYTFFLLPQGHLILVVSIQLLVFVQLPVWHVLAHKCPHSSIFVQRPLQHNISRFSSEPAIVYSLKQIQILFHIYMKLLKKIRSCLQNWCSTNSNETLLPP